MTPFSLMLIIVAGLNSCVGNLLLKLSRKHVTPDTSLIEQLLNPLFIGGMVFYVINVFLFAKALDSVPVSVAYPILATVGFVALAISSAFFLGESLSVSKIIGLCLALGGIGLLSSKL